MSNVDMVNHPPHYTGDGVCGNCDCPIECIDITRHMNFNLGNAMKYLWRAELKGHLFDDLRKARWYINDEIKRQLKLAGREDEEA